MKGCGNINQQKYPSASIALEIQKGTESCARVHECTHTRLRQPRIVLAELILFFIIIILFFNFTILYWLCHISTWIHHRYTRVSHPEPSSLLPPRTIPLGRPSAPATKTQYCASNLDWRLVSYMILYILQCHSPKSSHPLPLPQSPKDCSIHHCLFCCLVYRVIVTIFLNSIYMR